MKRMLCGDDRMTSDVVRSVRSRKRTPRSSDPVGDAGRHEDDVPAESEFRRYLECGIHAHGFARAICESCGDELLLPFSCKLRAICPICNSRRMSNTAVHRVDRVIAPDVTLRQWVLTVPFELRLLLAANPDALSAVGRLFVQEIQRWQRQQAEALGFEQAEGAAVSFCQRFGSSLFMPGSAFREGCSPPANACSAIALALRSPSSACPCSTTAGSAIASKTPSRRG